MPAWVMTTPPHECPTSTTGPDCASSTRRVAATSSASEVSGFCTETTCRPRACSRGMIESQDEPSAKAPWTRTTVAWADAADPPGIAVAPVAAVAAVAVVAVVAVVAMVAAVAAPVPAPSCAVALPSVIAVPAARSVYLKIEFMTQPCTCSSHVDDDVDVAARRLRVRAGLVRIVHDRQRDLAVEARHVHVQARAQ